MWILARSIVHFVFKVHTYTPSNERSKANFSANSTYFYTWQKASMLIKFTNMNKVWGSSFVLKVKILSLLHPQLMMSWLNLKRIRKRRKKVFGCT